MIHLGPGAYLDGVTYDLEGPKVLPTDFSESS